MAAMMATGTVLLVMTMDVILITDPISSLTGIFILTRFDHTVSRRELMFSITLLGKELSICQYQGLHVSLGFFRIIASARNMVVNA